MHATVEVAEEQAASTCYKPVPSRSRAGRGPSERVGDHRPAAGLAQQRLLRTRQIRFRFSQDFFPTLATNWLSRRGPLLSCLFTAPRLGRRGKGKAKWPMREPTEMTESQLVNPDASENVKLLTHTLDKALSGRTCLR